MVRFHSSLMSSFAGIPLMPTCICMPTVTGVPCAKTAMSLKERCARAESVTGLCWNLRRGKHGVLHVKCAVADSRKLLLTSANLTDHALKLNMELGLLVTGGRLPGRVEKHFDALVGSGVLERI